MTRLSVKTPLGYDDRDGPYTACHNMREVSYQNLKTLAFTNPGERIMDNNFGMGLRRKLFEQDTSSLRNEIQVKIRQQVASYLPYVRITDIQFSSAPARHILNIKISYVIATAGSVSETQEIVFGNDDKADGDAALTINPVDPDSSMGSVVSSIWDDNIEPVYNPDIPSLAPLLNGGTGT